MRKTIKVIILTLTFYTLSTTAFSQGITLNISDITVKEAIQTLKEKTGYSFVYEVNDIDTHKKISVRTTNKPIDDVVKQILIGQNVTYTIQKKNIIVNKYKKPNAERLNTNSAELKKISGIVTDQNDAPVIGATIMVKGEKTGTITNVNGNFSLDVFANSKLKISYLGYLAQEIDVNGESVIKVKLIEDSKTLDEVVVVGYGTMRKSDLTGSVSRLTNLSASENSNTSVEQFIQGKVSGVQINRNTGDVGSGMTFSIRGANSITGSNQPLVVIDGYPVETGNTRVSIGADASYGSDLPGTNALSMLNPNDIASIEILKDASSTAIYGSRGSNGVVLITTKRGKDGADKVEYSYRLDASSLPKTLDVLNNSEYMAYINEAVLDKNDGTFAYSQKSIDRFMKINTNWQDLIFKNGISQEHQVTLTGGDKKLKYALSVGYLNQEGIIKNTFFNRGTFRLNLDRTVNNLFSFGVNVNGNMSENKSVLQSGKATDIGASIVTASLRTPPLYEPYNETEEINIDNAFTNPLTLVETADDRNKVNFVNTALFATLNFTKALQFKIRVGLSNTDALRNYYMPIGTYLGNTRNGYAYEGNSRSINYLTENLLTYNKTLRKIHRLNVVVGYTWQSWMNHSIGSASADFPNDNLTYFNMMAGGKVDKNVTSTMAWALASYLGRFNYSYDDRFLATITARADGSTKLASGHKWDIFPSIAFGWNVHNESFIKQIEDISELKLRASWGISGNQSVNAGATKSYYNTVSSVINQTLQTGYMPVNMPNSSLGWENTEQYNAGLDLALFNGRLRFGYEYYKKHTTDLIINLPIPASTGYGAYTSNAGVVDNSGMEFEIQSEILKGKFSWSVSGNISFNRNEIVALDGQLPQFLGEVIGSVNSQPLNIAKIGYPIGSFYGYKLDGIYQTADEVKNGPVDASNPRPGDFKFKDISGPNGVIDGVINQYDVTVIGNPYPDFIYGITNDFSYKDFHLSIFIQGSKGQDLINANNYYLSGLSYAITTNVSREAYVNRWTGPGTSNKYPSAQSQKLPFFGRFTDFLVEDASFIRLKNVTLSYTFPINIIKHVSKFKLFVTGTNLFTVTNYSGYDPEVNSRGDNSLTPGIDTGSIPQFRTVSGGINVSF